MPKLDRSHLRTGTGERRVRGDDAHHSTPGRTTLTAALGGPAPPRAPRIGATTRVQSAGYGAAPPRIDAAPDAAIEAMFEAAAAGPRTEVPYRREMEHAFGRDLSGVKAVLDRPAELMAMRAEAATRGDTIVFAKASPSKLEVAHELAHYVQNTSGARPGAALSQPGDAAEHEADEVAHRAAAGEQVTVQASPTGTVQRMLVGWEIETIVPIYDNGERPDHVDGFARQSADYAHQDVDAALTAPLGAGFEVHIDSSGFTPKSALGQLNPNATMHIAEIVAKPVSSRSALLDKMKAVKSYLSYFKTARELTGGAFSMGWPTPQEDWIAAEPVSQGAPGMAPAKISRDELDQAFVRDWSASKPRLHEVYTQLTFQGPPESLKTIADLDVQTATVRQPAAPGPSASQPKGKSNTRRLTKKVEDPVVDREKMAGAAGVDLDDDLAIRAVDVAVKIFKDTLFFLTRPFTGTVKNSVAYLIRSDLRGVFADLDAERRNELAGTLRQALATLDPGKLGILPAMKPDLFDKGMKHIKVHRNVANLIQNKPEREAGELTHIDGSLQDRVSEVGEDRLLPWSSFATWIADQVHDAVRENGGGGAAVTGPLHGSENLGLLPEPGDASGAPQARVVFENRNPLAVRIDGDELPAEIERELDLVGFPK